MPPRKRPKLYASAFGPQAAAIAAKYGDGLWTLGDPAQAPEIIEAYRSAGGEGEIIFQAGFHLGTDEQQAIDSARKWKATQMEEVYRDDLHDPAEMLRLANQRVSDEEFAHEGFLVGADPEEHVSRLRDMVEAGASVICLQLIGDADPLGSIKRYGEEVLPALREAKV